MIDRGILFSAPMVRALVRETEHPGDGKTETRRLFKPLGFEFYTHPVSGDRYDQYSPYRDGTWDQSRIVGSGRMMAFGWGEHLYAYLPYAPGDRLWVREEWRSTPAYDDLAPSDMGGDEPLRYSADDATFNWGEADGDRSGRRRAGMHMPRWASRLTLIVEDIRVERLQEISEADAIAEGIERVPYDGALPEYQGQVGWKSYETYGDGKPHPHASVPNRSPITSYRELWDSLNGKEGRRWAENPWIVAVTFRVIGANIDQLPA